MNIKNIFAALLFLATFAAGGSLMADPIDPYDLPQKSQDFLRKAFFYAMPIAVDRSSNGYEVMMNDNSIIDLDQKGQWTNIVCMEGVPESVIPSRLRIYIKQRFEGQRVTRISRTIDEYQIEMATGVTLFFDNDYRLTKVN